MPELLAVDTAIERITHRLATCPAESILISDAPGRVLAEPVTSNINLPPFANSAMDGYAIIAADVANASTNSPVSLRVVMDIPAGSTPKKHLSPGECARIMTGAPLPDGADAIVPVEETNDSFAELGNPPPPSIDVFAQKQSGAHIRPIGENIQQGQRILDAGLLLSAADIGMLAALGKSRLSVIRRPRVAIISSGDELIEVDEPMQPGKIRDVNSYTLAALVKQSGGIPIRLPIAGDTPDELRALFHDAIAHRPDLIVSSAGVSVGAADYVRTILEEMGSIDFWKINLRPGKPLAYGELDGIPFFGLPGNPVSSMITFDILVRPSLLTLGGYPDNSQYVTAYTGHTMTSDGRRTYARVKLSQKDDKIIATETGTQSSGALMSMVMADGLLIIPEGTKQVEENTPLKVKLLRSIHTEGITQT